MKNTFVALPLSLKLHSVQTRKDGIYHPLVIACYAISLGLTEDVLVATILLHDVVEDCGVAVDKREACCLLCPPLPPAKNDFLDKPLKSLYNKINMMLFCAKRTL